MQVSQQSLRPSNLKLDLPGEKVLSNTDLTSMVVSLKQRSMKAGGDQIQVLEDGVKSGRKRWVWMMGMTALRGKSVKVSCCGRDKQVRSVDSEEEEEHGQGQWW